MSVNDASSAPKAGLGAGQSPEPKGLGFRFRNSYARLPERFYAQVAPGPVAAPRLIKINEALALQLALDPALLASSEGIAVLAGNQVAPGSEPLAMAYAGHQFGQFVPQLGDGRANLLGEVIGADGLQYDIQLKGSGRTPFSRGGDGRAALGPVLREYVVSEAMTALGVPSTRALAAVTTGEQVARETMLPGAVLTRVAASHLRVGTFQYFAARGDADGVRALADYAIARHYPEAADAGKPYRALLDSVVTRQSSLIARWMLLGFIHGVMNTDNMSISGETIDYGPCAFMESYEPGKVFSSIDRQGRYAYMNQPLAALWNLTRLAEGIFPALKQESGSEEAGIASAHEALEAFMPQYEAARLGGLRAKIGLATQQDGDAALTADLLQRMAANRADFTLTFRRLADAAEGRDEGVRSLFADPAAFDPWTLAWRERLKQESADMQARARSMRLLNPLYIPRNHLVASVIDAAIERQDFAPFEQLVRVLAHPFEERPCLEEYATPARPEQCVSETFCGT